MPNTLEEDVNLPRDTSQNNNILWEEIPPWPPAEDQLMPRSMRIENTCNFILGSVTIEAIFINV